MIMTNGDTLSAFLVRDLINRFGIEQTLIDDESVDGVNESHVEDRDQFRLMLDRRHGVTLKLIGENMQVEITIKPDRALELISWSNDASRHSLTIL